MLEKSEKILYIDGKDQHLNENNAITVHPEKLGLLNLFQKKVFGKVIVKNCPTDLLKSMSFFNICETLKENCMCEVYVYQPITVMQSMDANEITANAKLGGFPNIKSEPFEKWEKQGDKDIKIETIKLTMTKEPKQE